MGREIDLMVNYPRAKRDTKARGEIKTEAVRAIARQYGKEFFDGDRLYGYGGFNYNPRFWQPVVPTFQEHFGLKAGTTVLDIGCAKGFMMHDMMELIPGIKIQGIDISEYAISHAMDDVKPFVKVADACKLPFPDKSFDVVISINTVHNFDRAECIQAIREIDRVSRGKSFLTVDAFRDPAEEQRMMDWALTARTILHVDEWVKLFKEAGYTGDYYWFFP